LQTREKRAFRNNYTNRCRSEAPAEPGLARPQSGVTQRADIVTAISPQKRCPLAYASRMALLWAGGGLSQEVLVLDLLRAFTCEHDEDARLHDSDRDPEQ
jgi:hypothetical protein